MTLIRITGSQLHAARVLVGFSREEVAERAGLAIEDLAARAQLCRHPVRKWEGSSNAVSSAMVDHLSRALDVLEAEGIRFTDGGVSLQRPAPMSTVIASEGATA
jgi:hypothetical protein